MTRGNGHAREEGTRLCIAHVSLRRARARHSFWTAKISLIAMRAEPGIVKRRGRRKWLCKTCVVATMMVLCPLGGHACTCHPSALTRLGIVLLAQSTGLRRNIARKVRP